MSLGDSNDQLKARLAQLTGKYMMSTTTPSSNIRPYSAYTTPVNANAAAPPSTQSSLPLTHSHSTHSLSSSLTIPPDPFSPGSIGSTYSKLAPVPRSSTRDDALTRSVTPDTPHALTALTRTIHRTNSAKKKRAIASHSSSANAAAPVVAWSASSAVYGDSPVIVAPLMRNAAQIAENHSFIQTLARELNKDADQSPSVTSSAAPASSGRVSTLNPTVREFLSAPTLAKLQSVLATSWLVDERAIERTEEALLSARYYSSWKDSAGSKDDSSLPSSLQRWHGSIQVGVQEAMERWISLLSEGLFVRVAQMRVQPPAMNAGINIGDSASSVPVTVPSQTAIRFGSRTMYVLLDPDRGTIQVRVGGGFVDLVEFARNTAAVEGRKVVALMSRDELICLTLLLQERLLTTVLRKHVQAHEATMHATNVANDLRLVTQLESKWSGFETRLTQTLQSARIKLALQKLHWLWLKERRIESYATEEEARAQLSLEERTEERRVKLEDEDRARERQLASQSRGGQQPSSSSPSPDGAVNTFLRTIDESQLPSDLFLFTDDLGRAISDVSRTYTTLAEELAQTRTALNAGRAREMAAQENVNEVAAQLTAMEHRLHAAQAEVTDLTTLLSTRDTELAQLQSQHTDTSAAWSTKLSQILADLKRKDAIRAEEDERERQMREEEEEIKAEEHRQQDAIRQQTEEDLKNQIATLTSDLADVRSAHTAAVSAHAAASTRSQSRIDQLLTERASLLSSLDSSRHDLLEASEALTALTRTVRAHQEKDTNVNQQRERDARDNHREIEELRQTIRNMQLAANQVERERKEEKAKFKQELIHALKSSAAPQRASGMSPTRVGPPSIASDSRTALSPTKAPSGQLDMSFELHTDDILTELPSNGVIAGANGFTQTQRATSNTTPQYSSSPARSTPPHSASSPQSPSPSPSPSSSSAYVPLSLFTRLHSRATFLASQHSHALTRITDLTDSINSLESQSAQLEINLQHARDEHQSEQREVQLLQNTIATLRATADADFHHHQSTMQSVQSASERKIHEINSIYEQMLHLKDQSLVEVTGEKDRLLAELHALQSSTEEARQQFLHDQQRLSSAFGTWQAEKAQIEKTVQHQSTKLSSLTSTLRITHTELHDLKRAYVALRMSVMKMNGSGFNIDLVRTSLETQFAKHVAELNEYVARYKYELGLRRKYFDMVQELRGSIRVMVRIRPTLPGVATPTDGESVSVSHPYAPAVFTNSSEDPCSLQLAYVPPGGSKTVSMLKFEFDRVFTPEENQDQVFKHVENLVTSFMDGYNVCVFAYGQTGSGKTHTMMNCSGDVGVTYRVLDEMFRLRTERSHGFRYSISVSMLEILNESLNDLLAPNGTVLKEHKIQDTGSEVIITPPLTELTCESRQQILNAIAVGQRARATYGTASNTASSRSHSIVILKIVAHDLHSEKTFTASMKLIDLAGSERLKKSQSTGERLTEAKSINKSLSALGTVLQSLQRGDTHIGFRDSKLTHLLRSSLGGPAKTLLIVTITPDARDVPETFCSLQFGSRARKVELPATTGPTGTPKKKPGSASHSRSASIASATQLFSMPEHMVDADGDFLSASPSASGSLSPSPSPPAFKRTVSSPTGSFKDAHGTSPAQTTQIREKLKNSQIALSETQEKLHASIAREEALAEEIRLTRLNADEATAMSEQLSQLQSQVDAGMLREQQLMRQLDSQRLAPLDSAASTPQPTSEHAHAVAELESKLAAALARESTLNKQLKAAKEKRPASSPTRESTRGFSFALDDSSSHSTSGSAIATPRRSDRHATSSNRSKSIPATTPLHATKRAASDKYDSRDAASTPLKSVASSPAVAPAPSGPTAGDMAQLTTIIANLKLELLAKSRVESELAAEKNRHAEEKAEWSKQRIKWKEAEARRRVRDEMAAVSRKAFAGDSSPQSDSAAPPLLGSHSDVHNPESVAITRLTGDVYGLQHALRVQNKQNEIVDRFLQDKGLPTMAQICKDRQRIGGVGYHTSQRTQTNTTAHSDSHANNLSRQQSLTSPTNEQRQHTTPHTFFLQPTSHLAEADEKSESNGVSDRFVDLSMMNDSVQLDSIDNLNENLVAPQETSFSVDGAVEPAPTVSLVAPATQPLVGGSAGVSDSRRTSLASNATSRTNAAHTHRPNQSTQPTPTPPPHVPVPHVSVGYTPHRTKPVFVSLIPPPEVSASRKPRVPTLGKSFVPTSEEKERKLASKAAAAASASPAKKPPLPKQSPIKAPTSASKPSKIPSRPAATATKPTVGHSEPVVIKRKSTAPVPSASADIESSAGSTVAAAAAPPAPTPAPVAHAPTSDDRPRSAEFSDQPRADENATNSSSYSLSTPPPPVTSNTSNPIDPNAIPKLRGGTKKKEVQPQPMATVDTMVTIDTQPTPQPVREPEPQPISLPEPVHAMPAEPISAPPTLTPVQPPVASPFAGISFAQIAAEASAAVFMQSPSAAPFQVASSAYPTSATPTVATTIQPIPINFEPESEPEPEPQPQHQPQIDHAPEPVPSFIESVVEAPPAPPNSNSIPNDDSPPKFVGESLLSSALGELRSSASVDGGIDHLILLVVNANANDLASLSGECLTRKKVVVYAKGRDALSPKWAAMFLTDDTCCYILLLMRQPDQTTRFVLVEWIGGDTEMGEVLDMGEFSPILHEFLSRHIPLSLTTQGSHPSQVTRDSILAGLAASSAPASHRTSRASSLDSDGSFVDLHAQFAAEQAARANEHTHALALEPTTEDHSDIVTVEEVEAQVRAAARRNR